MADEDEMIVVIVDSNKEYNKDNIAESEIKFEPSDSTDYEGPDGYEMLMSHIQNLDEGSDFLNNTQLIKKEQIEEETLSENYDEEYVDGLTEDLLDDEESNLRRRRYKQHTLVVKSFVEELRQKYPDYVDDKELLVEHVAEIMRSIKMPPPPPNFYRKNGSKFECLVCNESHVSLNAVIRHRQNKHGTRYLICLACGVDFRSRDNLLKHEKHCPGPDRQIVLKARAKVIQRKGQNRPFLPPKQKGIKEKIQYNCTECSAVFVTKISLTAHEHLHRGERPFACEECPNKYTSQAALWRHQQSHIEGLEFICDKCGSSFKSKSSITQHVKSHEGKQFVCGFAGCGRRYAQKSALLLHCDKRHRGLPSQHQCQICQQRYQKPYLLKKHMKQKHGMNMMTRTMFLRSLPKLSDTEVKQARIFTKQDTNAFSYSDELKKKIEKDNECL